MAFSGIKRLAENLTGCHIYRQTLPRGADLCHDIKRLGPAYAPRRILDVGANQGQTATLFATAFPGAEIFSFEPISATFQALEKNVRAFPGVKCFQLALGSSKGEHLVHLKSMSTVNSLVPELNVPEAGLGAETIKIDTVDSFCRERGIPSVDILKVDTEGFDLEVIRGAEGLLAAKKVRFILAEVGFDENNKQHVLLEDLRLHLKPRGFVLFGLYEQTNDWSGKPLLLFGNALFICNDCVLD